MEFRIADTFTDSLARLTGNEQTAVKTTAFDLQLNPSRPGMKFHKLDRAKDKNFWSVYVNDDIRLIIHKASGGFLLCYVDHHIPAYDWAERRKLKTHPKTGAAQLVEIRETVQEITVPVYVEKEMPKPVAARKPLFARMADDVLLGYGVPTEWLDDVRAATEETLLGVTDHLPGEAAEALLELATGGKPRVPRPVQVGGDPFDHPDARRRFRLVDKAEELTRALDYPWDKWTVFLHPEQREWVERDYGGPARVSGSAGTGKTIVALHRAAHLARTNPDARVLLTTFTDTLANALHTKLKRLVSSEPRLAERIDVYSLDAIGQRLYKGHVGPAKLARGELVSELLEDAATAVTGHKFSGQFLLTEWEQLVDAWQLESWEAYRDVARLGRKTRLPEAQRAVLWSIIERVIAGLASRGVITPARLFTSLADAIAKRFVRSAAELDRSVAAAKEAGIPFKVLDEHVETLAGHLALCTMHLAKGLEFRTVVVMACDDEIIPSQERIQTVGDDADLQDVYDTERQLLYVACTRARDHLLVTSVEPASEFLDDLSV